MQAIAGKLGVKKTTMQVVRNHKLKTRKESMKHYTTKYKNEIEIKMRLTSQIPVFAHNANNDGKFVILHCGDLLKGSRQRITCIPKNGERLICWGVNNLHFKDTGAFLQASLEKSVDGLGEEDFKLPCLLTCRRRGSWRSSEGRLSIRMSI